MRVHRPKFFTVIGILVGALLFACLSPARFVGRSLRAQVVDAVTLQPVPDAQIEVRWSAWHPAFDMCNPAYRPVHTGLATTDSNGFFEIPSWGPVYLARWYSLDSAEPHLVIKRADYEDRLIGSYLPYGDQNGFAPLVAAKRLGADWQGKRIAFYPKGRNDLLRTVGFDPY